MKKCGKCKKLLNDTDFTKRKSGRQKGQLSSYCKDCQIEYNRQRNGWSKRIFTDTHKACGSCGEILEHDKFKTIASGKRKGKLRSTCIKCEHAQRRKPRTLPMDFKKCSKCKIIGHKSGFSHGTCKRCCNERKRAYRRKRAEHYRAYQAQWREDNQERLRRMERHRMINDLNGVRTRKLEKRKVRRKVDFDYRMRCVLRCRVKDALKGNSKTLPTMKLLGCSVEFFRKHIESQFQEGMTWENYGLHGWHLDHIKPCASFDLSDPEQQRQCFHYANMQPLWADENRSKSDRYDGPDMVLALRND